jgi:hypothetical protein
MSSSEKSEKSSSGEPFYGIIEPPKTSAPLRTWESHLKLLRRLPECSPLKNAMIDAAQWEIEQIKKERAQQ